MTATAICDIAALKVYDRHELASDNFTGEERRRFLQRMWEQKLSDYVYKRVAAPAPADDWFNKTEAGEEMDFSINSMPLGMFLDHFNMRWLVEVREPFRFDD
jgi:hypothetical protein